MVSTMIAVAETPSVLLRQPAVVVVAVVVVVVVLLVLLLLLNKFNVTDMGVGALDVYIR